MDKIIEVEKLTEDNQLTLEEQEVLLGDLAMAQVIIVGYQKYCKSIGKELESKIFVGAFLDKMAEEPSKGDA